MQRSTFAAYILLLTLAWMQVYASVREIYGGVREAIERERHAVARAEASEHRRALDHEAYLEFRQNVATLMPDAVRQNGRGADGYPLRALASVVSPGSMGDPARALLAKTTFDRGRGEYAAKEYEAAVKSFRAVIETYGYTSYVTEAYFLTAESYYQLNELEQCTQTVQRMIELFPHDELTGFAMVRLGHVYEERKRNDDAVDVYKTVLRTFPQRDVASQARDSLRGIDL